MSAQERQVDETMGRWGAAAGLGVVVGLALTLALSPQFGLAAVVIGLLAALAVSLGYARRRPELLDK